MTVRLLPDSLFGRLLTALLITVGVTLLVVVALLLSERRDSLFVGSDAAAIVNVIDTTAQRLARLPPEQRELEIERLRREPLAIERPVQPRPQRPSGAEAAENIRVLQSRLKRALGSGYSIEVKPARPGPADVIRLGPERRFERIARESGAAPGERGPGPRDEARVPGGPGGPGAPAGRPLGFGLRQLDVTVQLPDGGDVTFRTEMPRPSPGLPSGLLLELGL
ncbi:MAG TPA: hypothetical protein VHH11_10730, partial [Gammaproteobacteria bacterium]|nr:hypothetical protein [Gammaproteobacteria bacterium]